MTPSTAISGWVSPIQQPFPKVARANTSPQHYVAEYQTSIGAQVATPGVSNSVTSMGTIDGVANPAGIEWMSQFLSLAATNSPKYTFQAITMHFYGSSQNTADENGAMLNEQAGAMIQLAKDNGVPEVWITEMGSSLTPTATEDVSRTLCTCLKIYILDQQC